MKIIATLLMIIRYCISAPISILLTLLTWVLSPILALPIFIVIENNRQWLMKPVRWFQTHDTAIDEYWLDNYFKSNSIFKNKTQKDFIENKWYQYIGRMFWLCRNPAYGFAHYIFGWESNGKNTDTIIIKKGNWDSPESNIKLVLRDNPDSIIFTRKSFQLQSQFYFYKKHYLRINMGWKSHTGFTKMMLATFISPFRSWKS